MRKSTPASPSGTPPRSAPRAKKPTSPYSPAFRSFMRTQWRARKTGRVARVAGARFFQRRRDALAAQFAGEVLIVPTGHEKVRANDTCYPFRAGSDFYYLTGCMEPDAVLVLDVDRGGRAAPLLFVNGNPGRDTDAFYTDYAKGELWVGPSLTVAQTAARFAIADCRPLALLPAWLAQCKANRARPLRVLRGIDGKLEALLRRSTLRQKRSDQALMAALGEMRLVKDAHEIRALRRACQATARGFDDVIARLAVGHSEREVEGVFNLRARMEGEAVGYNTIAAAGHHACTLHWTRNDGPLQKSDLLLLDAGVEGTELYTADVTRTLPISGRFSAAQRQIYDLVRAAQQAGFEAVRPGNDFMAANQAAMRVLARGLERLGILDDAERDLQPDRQLYRRYTLHNVSHMLGLDVHDCAAARAQAYRHGTLKVGMVLTVEPGLYFQRDDLTVPARYRGIGVRIEDDVVVTRRGCTILSDLPRDAVAVERWMQQVWADNSRCASRP